MPKTLNMAHRGASAYAPENTLAAFKLAFDMGADGIELDVAPTRDGVPVVMHDDTVDRTTDGHGAIRDLTLDEIKRLDAGITFDVKFRGERVPTLAEVLSTVAPRGLVNIELKFGKLSPTGLEAAAVARVIKETDAANRVFISSFNRFPLHEIGRVDASLPLGLSYCARIPIPFQRPLQAPSALHPEHVLVNPGFVRWAHGKGYKINTWTVNDPVEMKRLVGLGVDAIITNKPDVLRHVISEHRSG